MICINSEFLICDQHGDGKEQTVLGLSTIRQIGDFRTVSDEAVPILAKIITIDVFSHEMTQIYFHLEYPEQIAAIKAEEQRTSMHKRQPQWENSLKGR